MITKLAFRRRAAAATATFAVVLALGACGGGEDEEEAGGSPDATAAENIVFWTPQTTPERVAAQQEIAAAFTAESGIEVEVVPLAGADQNQALVTGAASGDVPDVILHAPDQTAAWNQQGLLDTAAAQELLDELGPDTFNQRAIEFVTLDEQVAAVPSDGWAHLIVYRSDLLAAAGLEPPASLADLAEVATATSSGSVSGMAMGTQPGTPSATEALESMLQPTGCQLVTDGEVTIDSPECVEGLEIFAQLAESSVAGQFDVPSARAAYLAGNAAMLVFSSHIIDELAGLDPANPPTCAECADDPAFLAENSGFVTVLDGGAQYGTTLNYGIPTGANTAEAQEFIRYVMSDGYVESLAAATEGRIPLRLGTADRPTEYIDAWGELPFGATPGSDLSIADVYGDEVVTALADGTEAISRWGFGTPDAELAGAVFAQNVLSNNLESLYTSGDAQAVASAMAEAVAAVQQEVGG